jgi:hypothetical protein
MDYLHLKYLSFIYIFFFFSNLVILIFSYTRNDIKHKIFEGHEFSLLDERYRLL